MATYSFLNCQAAIVGPGGAFNIGTGAGVADEGITISLVGDKDSMTIGADGTPMHTLNADKSGTLTVRLLKTSPTNAQLSLMYAFQSVSSALHGNNTITVRDSARGDVTTCRQVAFRKQPALTYSKAGAVQEWEFNAGIVDQLIGVGTPSL
ncbi:MAG: DUF3277 family protein [Acetobacteraceae bacterium]